MDIVFFFQTVAAVFVGGLMLAGFLWAGWTSVRLEKKGLRPENLPWRIYAFLAIPLVFCVLMLWLTPT